MRNEQELFNAISFFLLQFSISTLLFAIYHHFSMKAWRKKVIKEVSRIMEEQNPV